MVFQLKSDMFSLKTISFVALSTCSCFFLAKLINSSKCNSKSGVLTKLCFSKKEYLVANNQTNYNQLCEIPTLITLKINKYLKKLDELDKIYSDKIHKLSFGYWDYLMVIPGTIFGVFAVPLFCLYYLKIINKNEIPIYPYCVLFTVINTELLKILIGRNRPLHKQLGKKLINLRKVHNSGSMPSGDVAQASVTAMTMIYHGYSSLWLFVLVPFGTFGRVYFGSHYIGDCIIGSLIGIICSYCTHYCHDQFGMFQRNLLSYDYVNNQ